MYNQMPPKYRKRYRVALTIGWLLAAGAGASTLIVEPLLLAGIESYLRYAAGAGLVTFATLAGLGVMLNRYRLEWSAAWFSASVIAPFTGIYLWSAVSAAPGRWPVTFLLASLLAFFVSRAFACSAYAEVLRELHEMQRQVDDA